VTEARLAANEEQRLAALREAHLLDTAPEEDYEAIARLAAQICQTPIAMVSLVDRDRQWFKAEVGFGRRETPRSVSFCAHALLQGGVFLVPDATLDPRFADNPLVTREPHIRFYAGAPIVTPDGCAVGTVCVMDAVPRQFTNVQQDGLRSLARQATAEIELRRLVSQLKRSLADAREGAERLGAAYQELEMFSYSASHDLRAPVRRIAALVDSLSTDVGAGLPAEGIAMLDRIRAECTRMTALVSDLLRLSESAQGNVRNEDVDLTDLAKLAIRAARSEDPERQVEVTVEEGLRARGDGGLLRIVLDNLVANAWKYSREATPAMIRVGSAPPTNGAPTFCVADNGIGFEMAQADRLFRPFERLTADPRFPGVGLGLTIVRRIVARHGGRVWAESRPGEGATFYFTLPGLLH